VATPAGFPDHPHRGMTTVTYVLPNAGNGCMEHEDSVGNAGMLRPGDLQFMTAGRGILHAEVPENETTCHGLQLWVNLPAKHKMDAPEYQELRASELREASKDGVRAVVIAGEAFGAESQIRTKQAPMHYIHFTMSPSSRLVQNVPEGWNCLAYTLRGRADFGRGEDVDAHNTVTFSNEPGQDGVVVQTTSESAEFVLISGRPNDERACSIDVQSTNAHPLRHPVSLSTGICIERTKSVLSIARTDRPARTVRDEHARGNLSSVRRLSGRQERLRIRSRLAKRDSIPNAIARRKDAPFVLYIPSYFRRSPSSARRPPSSFPHTPTRRAAAWPTPSGVSRPRRRESRSRASPRARHARSSPTPARPRRRAGAATRERRR